MDLKLIRAGINSAIIALLSARVLGTFGGWRAILDLPENIFGAVLIACILSTALGFVYHKWFADFLPGSPLVKGVLFGSLLWIVFLILGSLTEFFKESVYNNNNFSLLFLSLMNHWVWGGSLTIFLETKPTKAE